MNQNMIDLDPEHQTYLTVQSKQFAMTAKKFMSISWSCNEENNNNNAKSKLSHIFPCLPILHSKHHGSHGHDPRSHNNKAKQHKTTEEHEFELIGESLIMHEYHIRCLGLHLPSRVLAYPWTLKFCTSIDGFSLHSMYRKLHKVDSSPVLIVIEDLDKNVFGALASCNPHVSDHFYGTSDCFLFTFEADEFHEYKWAGDNFYFIRGSETELCFGSGNGHAGLWLDSDLNKGRTDKCSTYGNPPLVSSKDFIIKNLECWTFG